MSLDLRLGAAITILVVTGEDKRVPAEATFRNFRRVTSQDVFTLIFLDRASPAKP
jgi:hypothetical protein